METNNNDARTLCIILYPGLAHHLGARGQDPAPDPSTKVEPIGWFLPVDVVAGYLGSRTGQGSRFGWKRRGLL